MQPRVNKTSAERVRLKDHMMSDWYVYMVRCVDGSLYTGISTDVARRTAGAKYLKGKGPLTLVFKQKVGSKSLALKLERQVKRLPKVEKEDLLGVPGIVLQ